MLISSNNIYLLLNLRHNSSLFIISSDMPARSKVMSKDEAKFTLDYLQYIIEDFEARFSRIFIYNLVPGPLQPVSEK